MGASCPLTPRPCPNALSHALSPHGRDGKWRAPVRSRATGRVVESVTEKYRKSRRLLDRARQTLPGGVSSPFRAKLPEPLYFADGSGARLWDVDGNEYIDFALAWGPLILGHKHPRIVDALTGAAAKPHNYGAQHELEPQVGETIRRLVPCAEKVALTSSGSEALQLAFRLARAHSGRPLVLKFEGHYHGWMDSALISYKPPPEQVGARQFPNVLLGSGGQAANSVDNVVVARWNDISALEMLLQRRQGEIAAVVMEPVLCNSGCLMPRRGYLDAVREACDRSGALLIFDEVITGFRIAPGGAQQAFAVTPDIATLGKALGGGAPISAVAGRAEILDQLARGKVAFGGTFNGNPLSLAATDACLEVIAENNAEALKRANQAGERLIDGIRRSAARHGRTVVVAGFGAAFAIHFTRDPELWEYRDTFRDDRQRLDEFLRRALGEGLYLLPDGRFYVSAAHTSADIDESIAAVDRVFESMSGL